ncbi:MAG: hypothetical protein RLY16_246 [Bacteroidota bacterium]|jgi:hypothetical protein
MSTHSEGAHHHQETTTTGGVKILLPLILLIGMAVLAFYTCGIPVKAVGSHGHPAGHTTEKAAHEAPAAH